MAELLYVPDYDGAIFIPEHVGDFLCSLAFEIGQLEAIVDKADYDLRAAMMLSGIWRKPVVAFPMTCAVDRAVERLRDERDELRRLCEQLKMVEAERDVWSGKACEEEQANGKGPCGACRHCLPTLRVNAQRRAERAEHEVARLTNELRVANETAGKVFKENEELRRAAHWTTVDDRPLGQNEENAIRAAHPMRSGRHDVYAEALRIVEAKQSKYGLVDVVNWLLHEKLAPATGWELKAMELARVLDVWTHDKACARLRARHGGRAPVPCDCNLDHTLTAELCARLDAEKK